MFNKAKLSSAVALAVLSLGAASNASAHNMYNKFTAGDSSTDGWVYGDSNESHPTVSPGFTGTASTPFGYAGEGWVNWAAAIHHTGVAEISDADAGFDADLDTNKGSWNDDGQNGNDPQGWAHNTDIGLIKADHDMTLTLNISNVDATNHWNNYGITVFEGMNTGAFDSHHDGWNVGWTASNQAAAQQSNPFGLEGLTYLTHDETVDAVNGLTFFAEAGKVYTVLLGGHEFGSVFGPTADYKLSITAVPVPAAIWLFGSAIAGMGAIGRRKQKTV